MSSDRELEIYAEILATLAQGQVDSSALLAQHGLDEQRWGELSARCEAALDRVDEGSDASALERFSAAFAQAQATLSGGPAALDVWLSVLTALARGEALLARVPRFMLVILPAIRDAAVPYESARAGGMSTIERSIRQRRESTWRVGSPYEYFARLEKRFMELDIGG